VKREERELEPIRWRDKEREKREKTERETEGEKKMRKKERKVLSSHIPSSSFIP
jgi:hypothetical protein